MDARTLGNLRDELAEVAHALHVEETRHMPDQSTMDNRGRYFTFHPILPKVPPKVLIIIKLRGFRTEKSFFMRPLDKNNHL